MLDPQKQIYQLQHDNALLNSIPQIGTKLGVCLMGQ